MGGAGAEGVEGGLFAEDITGRKRMRGAGGRRGKRLNGGKQPPFWPDAVSPCPPHLARPEGAPGLRCPRNWERRRVMGGCGGYF